MILFALACLKIGPWLLLRLRRRWRSMRRSAHWTTGPVRTTRTHTFVHLQGLHALLRRQNAEELCVRADVLDHHVGTQLSSLVGQSAHLRFVKLPVDYRGFDLFVNIFHPGLKRISRCALGVENRFCLRLLRIAEVQLPRDVLQHIWGWRRWPVASMINARTLTSTTIRFFIFQFSLSN